MKPRFIAWCVCVTSCAWLLGCGAAPTGLPSTAPGDRGSSGDVSGVPSGGSENGASAGRPLPLDSIVQARVRNESSSRVDVTMRFIHDDSVVNLSFVRVPPKTVTTVSSPEMANEVEMSGLDESGRALESAMFVFGEDFDASVPAEYVVLDPDAVPSTDDAQNASATLALSEPSATVTRAVGSTLRIAWNDLGGSPTALVRLYLRPVGNNTPSQWTPAGPAISAQFDGVNDSLTIVIPTIKNGSYEVVGQLQSGNQTATAVAPGKVQIVSDQRNLAPTLAILSPTSLVELASDQEVPVSWRLRVGNASATIRFSLERSDGTGTAIGRFAIGPPIAAAPHKSGSDSASLPLKGVLPGLYDLVGTIDDGRLIGTTRVERAVRILPGANNDAPQLSLRKPASDVDVLSGGKLGAAWTDSDENDDARISFYLDADWSAVALDGNEYLLQTGVREDPDASGDSLDLLLPSGLPLGKYRLVGVITDGMTQVVTRAPGFVIVRGAQIPPASPGPKPEDSGGKDTQPPSTGTGDTADKNDGDKSDPAPPSGGGSGSGGSTGGDEKNDDPGKDPGQGGGKDDPGKDGGGKNDPGGDDPDKDDTGGGDPPTNDPGIVVIAPDADLPGDRSSTPSPIPSEPGQIRPVDGAGDDGGNDGGTTPPQPPREVVVLIPNAGLFSDRASVPTAILGQWAESRPQSPDGIGLVASNVRFGGVTTVDVTPDGWTGREAETGGEVRIRVEAIPSDAWPRKFDVYLTDSTRVVPATAKPIIVPQPVEILDVVVGGGACASSQPDVTASSGFAGVRITWFGGGTTDDVAPAEIEFWLSADAAMPPTGANDKLHRRITAGSGSPNAVRQTEFDWREMFGSAAADRGTAPAEVPPLAPGQYRIVAVARFADFGAILTTASSAAIPVCQP